MKWVTRARPKTDRIACPWLIKKFIDPEQRSSTWIQIGCWRSPRGRKRTPSMRRMHATRTGGGKCTFEVLIDEYELEGDPALVRLARIVHGADIAGDEDVTPQSAGLKAIAEGFSAVVADDQRLLQMEMPVYDALYEWCKRQE
ncbi:MAG: chromate resistance protein [Actinomycetota bacterium]|nr:chromate resistance protein [Actinomycetota bacterium]